MSVPNWNFTTTTTVCSPITTTTGLDTTIIYSFCPVAGVVCNICQVCVNPIASQKSHTKRMWQHEENNRSRHAVLHDLVYRSKVVSEFTKFVREMADMIMEAPTLAEARNTIIQFLELGEYLYCSQCSKLVGTKKHAGGSYHACYDGNRQGYKTKVNLRKTRWIILPLDFQLNENTLCSGLWDILRTRNFAARLQFWNSNEVSNQVDVGAPLLGEMDRANPTTVHDRPNSTNDTEPTVPNNTTGTCSTETTQPHHQVSIQQDPPNPVIDLTENELPNPTAGSPMSITTILLNRIGEMERNLQLTAQDQHTIIMNRIHEVEQRNIRTGDGTVPTTSGRKRTAIRDTTTGNDPQNDETNTARNGHGRTVHSHPTEQPSNDDDDDTDRRERWQKMELQLQQVTRERDQLKENTDERFREMESHMRQRIQEMEWQLQQVTRERDRLKDDTDERFREMNSKFLQLMTERDAAVLLTEDMEQELCRLSQELDDLTDADIAATKRPVAKHHTRTATDDSGKMPNGNKKRKMDQHNFPMR